MTRLELLTVRSQPYRVESKELVDHFLLAISHNVRYIQSMAYKSELEALILGALREGPLHGYAIVQTIKTKRGPAEDG